MFNKLSIHIKEIYEKVVNKENFISCEYSFSTLYMWRGAYRLLYSFFKDIFIIKKCDDNYGTFFMEPLGNFNDDELIRIIYYLEDIRKEDKNIWLLGDVTRQGKERLERIIGEKIIIEEEKNNFDYIYKCEKLIDLKGNIYRNKRNKINHFKNTYDYKKNIINRNLYEEELVKYREFLNLWSKEHSVNHMKKFLDYEIKAIEDLLLNIGYLGLDLIEIYVNEKLIGFSIGEQFNKNLCIIHVEKCLKEFNGAYAFINNEFLKECYQNIKYVNREEDLGIEGLRRSKISYIPDFLEKKYLIRLK